MANVDRSISTVLHDIVGNVQDIIRSEVRLAETEVTEELGKLGHASILLAVGALLLTFSALFALLAIIYALSAFLPAWEAALIVAAGVGAIAALCCGLGLKKFKAVRAAPKTTASVKENVEWAKQLTR